MVWDNPYLFGGREIWDNRWGSTRTRSGVGDGLGNGTSERRPWYTTPDLRHSIRDSTPSKLGSKIEKGSWEVEDWKKYYFSKNMTFWEIPSLLVAES